jgi:hypothetical protein
VAQITKQQRFEIELQVSQTIIVAYRTCLRMLFLCSASAAMGDGRKTELKVQTQTLLSFHNAELS